MALQIAGSGLQHVHPFLVAQLLALLTIANGVPLIATKILGTFLAWPLDNGIILGDGQRLFGQSKTIRGVALSIIVTASSAPWVGLDWTIGLVVSATAMTGDLLSSFIKRRVKLAPGSMALGLDQTLESLLPAIACRWILPITILDIVSVTALFFIGELVASRALYALNIRDRPY
jgi:CDP-diglyceride synthetase